jgi:O-antigen/teichoic acid export membrane protein
MMGYLAVNPDYENGCYAQALKLNQTIRMLITVIDSVMMVRNFSDYAAKKYDSVKSHLYLACSYVIHLGIPLIFGICVLSSSLSAWFLGEGYAEVPMLLNILSLRFVFSGLTCVFGNQLFIVVGKEKYATWAHIAATITNLVLNFIFIPKFGAIGAAVSFAIAEIVDCLVLAVLVFKEKYLSLKKVLKMFIKPVIAAGVMLIIIIPLNGYFAYNIFTFALIAAVGAGIYGIVLLVMKDDFVDLLLVRYAKPMLHKFLLKNKC